MNALDKEHIKSYCGMKSRIVKYILKCLFSLIRQCHPKSFVRQLVLAGLNKYADAEIDNNRAYGNCTHDLRITLSNEQQVSPHHKRFFLY